MNNNGTIYDIQRYCIHDGPGIRTVVYLKGCPLRCIWCCNPESQNFKPELEFRYSMCINCGRCKKACPNDVFYIDRMDMLSNIDYNKCLADGNCVKVCPTNALRIIGEEMSVDKVMENIKRDRSFYRRSGGGVTLSGGEPLSQPDFSKAILQQCYDNNIHTAIETTGYADWSFFEEIIPYTDLFLFDLKHTDSEIHKKLTGVSNNTIISNLKTLAKQKKNIIIRLPLLKPFNGTTENLYTLACLMNEIGLNELHIMPFHQLGKDKYKRLGREYLLFEEQGLKQTDEGIEFLKNCQRQLESYGLNVVIGG